MARSESEALSQYPGYLPRLTGIYPAEHMKAEVCHIIYLSLFLFTLISNNSEQYMLTIYINIWPSIAVGHTKLH